MTCSPHGPRRRVVRRAGAVVGADDLGHDGVRVGVGHGIQRTGGLNPVPQLDTCRRPPALARSAVRGPGHVVEAVRLGVAAGLADPALAGAARW